MVLVRRLLQDLTLLAAAGDGPEEQVADVAGDDGGEGVECLGRGPDQGDGGAGVEGEDVEGVEELWVGGC